MKKILLTAICTILIVFSPQFLLAQWTTSGTSIYYNTGNVGIGVTAPGTKLDIQTSTGNDGINLRYSTTGFLRIAANSFGAGAYNNLTQSGDAGIIYGGSAPGATFGFVIAPWASGLTGIRVDPSGNLGIGTANTQGYQLAVNGSAIFTKAVVKLYASWPDYVFEKGYKIPTLQSLEAYLKNNNHLPEMPSSAEVEKNGIDLGVSQTLLLKKIEELTLYIIEQQKEIEKLKVENNRVNILADKLAELEKSIRQKK